MNGVRNMATLARMAYLESELGVDNELARAGSALEHPLVYDDAAREFKRMAEDGLVEIIEERVMEQGGERLIGRLRFRRTK